MRRLLEMNMMKCVSKSWHFDCPAFVFRVYLAIEKKMYLLYSLHENADLSDVCQNYVFDFENLHIFRDQPEAPLTDMD